MFGRAWAWGSRTAVATLVVVAGVVFGAIFLALGLRLAVPLGTAGSAAAAVALSEAGLVAAGLAFLAVTGRGVDYLDLRKPSARDLGYVVVGTFALLGIRFGGGLLVEAAGVSFANRTLRQFPRANLLTVLLVLVPLSVLVIGPGEELLFRNVVQKYLAESLSNPAAVVVASGLFALVHLPNAAVAGVGSEATVAVLALLFCISVGLGVVYARTENLVVPALVHGLYDAAVFAGAYLSLLGGRVV